MRPGRNGTAGFSLIEALVALAIAAFLAAILTRFASDTRWNAFKVREQVAMELLSDGLLDGFITRELQPGRTDGRAGALGWHIDVAPITIYARARSLSEKERDSGDEGPATAFGSTSASNQSAKKAPAAAKSKPTVIWTPYHVTAIITAPSGRSHAIDTIKIAPQRPEQRPSQGDQR